MFNSWVAWLVSRVQTVPSHQPSFVPAVISTSFYILLSFFHYSIFYLSLFLSFVFSTLLFFILNFLSVHLFLYELRSFYPSFLFFMSWYKSSLHSKSLETHYDVGSAFSTPPPPRHPFLNTEYLRCGHINLSLQDNRSPLLTVQTVCKTDLFT
jgi:hypothetical protein